eukprot:6621061-Pyramimonas_sp.AAC.1
MCIRDRAITGPSMTLASFPPLAEPATTDRSGCSRRPSQARWRKWRGPAHSCTSIAATIAGNPCCVAGASRRTKETES